MFPSFIDGHSQGHTVEKLRNFIFLLLTERKKLINLHLAKHLHVRLKLDKRHRNLKLHSLQSFDENSLLRVKKGTTVGLYGYHTNQ